MKNSPTSLYLIRHARADTNRDVVIGSTDPPLSSQGIKQAEALLATISHPEPAIIYSSGLKRAKQTAERLYGNSVRIKTSPLINEMNFGDWENRLWNDIYQEDPNFFNQWANNWLAQAPPNGESFNEVSKRCRDWYNANIKSDKSMVVIAHGGSLRALLCIILDLPLDRAFSFEFDHCHVSKINFNQGNAKIAFLNSKYFA